MKIKGKRGIAPIVATVLLISLTVILAGIIFIWAKNFFPEQIQKLGEPAENYCNQVQFDAEYDAPKGEISVINRGNVPLYGVSLSKKSIASGSVEKIDNYYDNIYVVGVGETNSYAVSGISAGDEVIVTPVILGEKSTGERKGFECSDSSAISVSIE